VAQESKRMQVLSSIRWIIVLACIWALWNPNLYASIPFDPAWAERGFYFWEPKQHGSATFATAECSIHAAAVVAEKI